jgi:hypothetical protein
MNFSKLTSPHPITLDNCSFEAGRINPRPSSCVAFTFLFPTYSRRELLLSLVQSRYTVTLSSYRNIIWVDTGSQNSVNIATFRDSDVATLKHLIEGVSVRNANRYECLSLSPSTTTQTYVLQYWITWLRFYVAMIYHLRKFPNCLR